VFAFQDQIYKHIRENWSSVHAPPIKDERNSIKTRGKPCHYWKS